MATLASPFRGATRLTLPDWLNAPLLGLFALLALGGMGGNAPLVEGALALLSALLIGWVVVTRRARLAALDRAAMVLITLIAALPLIQLIPLPPALWQSLAGREREAAILTELGGASRWMPLSLDPEATRAALLGLLPAVALFLIAALAGRGLRSRLVRLSVALALASAVLGAAQLASGGALTLVDTVHAGHALGLFSNRNHQADFLLIAMLLLGASVPAGRARGTQGEGDRWIASGLVALLAAAVLATSSRSGAGMALLVLPAALALVWDRRLGWKLLAGGLALGVAGLAALLQTGAGQALLARLSSPDDDRLTFWRTIVEALPQQSLLGSGFGTFAAQYRAIEPLDAMTEQYVNHAHNDYLQLLVEGGVPTLVLVALVLAWIALRGRAALRPERPRAERRLALAALGGLTVLLAHSVVDYPARMTALAALAGLLLGLLLPAQEGSAPSPRKTLPLLAAAGLAALTAWQAGVTGLARHAVVTDDAALAQRMAPVSAEAGALAARFRLEAGAPGAEALARAALTRAPLDVQALSTLALARSNAGDEDTALRLLDLAAQGGWWDFGTQWALFDRARALGLPELAMQRADALLRRGGSEERLYPLLAQDLADTDFRTALAARLETRPAWREAFLQWLDGAAAEPAAVDALWQDLARGEAPPSVKERARHAAALARQGRFAQARAAWLPGHAPALADPHFIQLFRPHDERPDVPFEWRLDPAGADSAFALEESGGGLQVEARAGFDSLLARQLVVLAPGPVTLGWLERGDGEGVEWRLRCTDGRRIVGTMPSPGGESSGWQRRSMALAVPADCPAQWLELAGNGSSLAPVNSAFRAVELAR